ncbi:DUF2235 domain-containing protein [Fulvivirga sp. M361]|uniref:DUF2235 domain-containing protein n=1 Tax=Fulvivirga sp. M361 TaxID=2594266 RepID=UPI00117B15D5|nr:DUF2235 domain-containing protein [Fulvivirga sp. M361]TRX58997.1 DUF2235 domain-containing protein [Fulvivirga sp. M361]
MKRIIICADGTWNRPEENIEEDHPSNVLKFARGIAPKDTEGIKQVVFYDWGIGSYHDKLSGGGFGAGLEKNVMDGYRFLVHNYEQGDEIYLFGFSRGAYTVRSLCGLINNCNILKGSESRRIEEAFELYKNPAYIPMSDYSVNWRNQYAIEGSSMITFIGVWDTVGAMGLPFSFFGLIKDQHRFYDNKLGSNVITARHALSLDERRDDFEPTIWQPNDNVDLKQVWFAGVHTDVGGGYENDPDGTNLSDIPMTWLMKEAQSVGLSFEDFLYVSTLNPTATQHDEYKGFMRFLGKYIREIPDPDVIPTLVHSSVKERYENSDYKSAPIEKFINDHNQWPVIED